VINDMCERDLESAIIETKEDLSAGRFVRETAEQHLARLKIVEITLVPTLCVGTH